MQTEIIANANRTVDDAAQLQALSRTVYGPLDQIDEEIARITWAPTEFSVVVRRNADAIVAHAGFIVRDALLNDQPVRIGGIGGVKTHPDVRGQHLGDAVMRRAADYLNNELEVDFSLLVCADEIAPFYQRLGWKLFPGELWVEQPTGRERFTFNKPMLLSGVVAAPDDGVIDLQGHPW